MEGFESHDRNLEFYPGCIGKPLQKGCGLPSALTVDITCRRGFIFKIEGQRIESQEPWNKGLTVKKRVKDCLKSYSK